MFSFLATRHRQPEWMDAPDADRDQLERSLRYIRRINQIFGYTRATLSHLARFSARWNANQTIRILDLGTGSADMPQAILKWAARRRFDVQVVGMDLHADTTLAAAAEARPWGDRLRIVRGDALEPPFEEGSFDYVMTNMFLHHLDDAPAERVLAIMGRLARRGIIAADLLRNRRAYGWMKLFTLWANPMVRHDARVSVAGAFAKPEVLGMRDRAGLGFAEYYRHFGHRFVLAGEKA